MRVALCLPVLLCVLLFHFSRLNLRFLPLASFLISFHLFIFASYFLPLCTLLTATPWCVSKQSLAHIREVGSELVEALLSAFPLAAHRAYPDGKLPLHVALECSKPLALLNLLIRANPGALLKKMRCDRDDEVLPVEYAIRHAMAFPVVEALMERKQDSARAAAYARAATMGMETKVTPSDAEIQVSVDEQRLRPQPPDCIRFWVRFQPGNSAIMLDLESNQFVVNAKEAVQKHGGPCVQSQILTFEGQDGFGVSLQRTASSQEFLRCGVGCRVFLGVGCECVWEGGRERKVRATFRPNMVFL